VDLRAFVAGISDIVRIKADEKDLVFRCEAAADLPARAQFDEKRLRQVLLNLLGNAIKFTDTGMVSLDVRCTRRHGGVASIRFEVRDTGIGMEAAQLERIFQPFEQVGHPQRKFGGTGLGLSISRQLVRSMGGEIAVTSEPGHGSAFAFEIDVPLTDAPIEAAPPERAIVGYRGPRKRVLVVDDVDANRGMLRDLLQPLGFDVCMAANGFDGIEQAIARHPDAILMDVVMPVMDGLEAARRIRQLPGFDRTRIIAISASVAGNAHEAAARAHIDAFLGKPVQHRQLLQLLADLLGLSLIHDEAPGVDTSQDDTVALPPGELDALRQVAREGDMRLVRQQANHIETLDARFKPLADQLRQLAETFQVAAIREMVRSLSERRTTL
jgi:CheY-like chemotaxis protein